MIKWAIANGQWSDGTTWNDGVVPTSGDFVYCNGYTISFPTQINIGNGTITNELNPNTNRNGGKIQSTSGPVIIAANLIADGEMIFQSGHINNTITGNITIKNTPYGLYRSGNSLNSTWNINGNLVVENGYFVYDINATFAVNINGNVTMTDATTPIKSVNNMSVNGTLTIANYSFNVNSTFTLNGNLYADYCRVYAPNLRVYGNIYYRSNNTTIGIAWQTLTISSTTEWKDLTEPRSNPFIILTDAELANRQQYPAESDVRKDVEYAWGAMKGIMESGVQVGCVTKEDVREGVPLLGMGEVGTCAVPSPDDVREGVPVDNTIGTLIVQGGGDRLRIADFGYYTNAQSDTYIVDITEADKPKFASAEERILIEMFPTLDLDNIPEMYFDELFVKYLKYRLIVEYYRTAGINSTFTPSEPTTEIVNYRNVTCEVWLNSANIYLNAWNKKYGLNKPPKKVRL